MQAVYVPADDYTDPAPANVFAHLDATTNLTRDLASRGLYPAVDPLASTSRILDPQYVGQDHYEVATRVKQIQIGRAHVELQSRGHLVCRLLLVVKYIDTQHETTSCRPDS